MIRTALLCVVSLLFLPACGFSTEKAIIDTDIGDDIDDAFAVALALRSPQLEILGITTTFREPKAVRGWRIIFSSRQAEATSR